MLCGMFPPSEYSWASPEESDKLSTLYDVGGIFGGAIGGLISVCKMKSCSITIIMEENFYV